MKIQQSKSTAFQYLSSYNKPSKTKFLSEDLHKARSGNAEAVKEKRDPFITVDTPHYVKKAFELLTPPEKQSLRKIAIVTMGNERLKNRNEGNTKFDY